MKKKLARLGFLWIPVLLGFMAVAHSTTTCTNTDMYCYESGSSQNLTTIGRLDSSGNLTVAGNQTISGNQTITGNQILTGNSTSAGKTILTPQVVTGISTTTTITPTGTYIQLLSTQNVVTIGRATGNAGQVYYAPISTATATAGQVIVLYSTSPTSYVVISTGAPSGIENNGLVGSATTLSVAPPKVLMFIFDAVSNLWKEVHD